MTKEQQKNLIENCIERGKFVDYKNVSNLPHDTIIEIENVLYRYNDKTAKSKIRKIINYEK